MMKHLSAITLIILLLLISCRQERAVSPRLVELDSLIAVAPDSAAALLEAIPTDSLRNPENRAYHALLTTQAKYKADIHAYSLDTINFAVCHYSDGHDREKQTRSILFKGCVMEELQQLDSAMCYYLEACHLAEAQRQHQLLAYVQFRIAQLYQYSYIEDELAIQYYNKSFELYHQMCDSLHMLYCVSELAVLYRKVNPDTVPLVARKAIEISFILHNDIYYSTNLATLATHYLYIDSIELAKSLALEALSVPSIAPVTRPQALNTVCQALLLMGKTDSAQLFFEQIPSPISSSDSVRLLRTQAEMAYAKGDLKEYVLLSDMAGEKAGEVLVRSLRNRLAETQSNYELERESARQANYKLKAFTALVVMLSLLLLLLACSIWIYRVSVRRRMKWERARSQLNAKLAELSKQTGENELQIKTVTLALSTVSYLGKRGASSFKDDKDLITANLPQEFWDDAEMLTRKRLSKCLQSMEENGIELKKEEMKVLSLCLCGVPDVVIAKLMDYSSRRTVHNIKAAVAKKLDSSDGSLSDKLTKLIN